jgi:DNA-binding transcriptional MerR regulator
MEHMSRTSLDGLMSIGMFAETTRLSVKTLRRYDAMGLLEPAAVDPDTGYRYYAPDQTARGEAIRSLRSLDMPLADISVALDSRPERRREVLLAHRERLEQAMTEQRRRLETFEAIVEGKTQLITYAIEITQTETIQFASVRSVANHDNVGQVIADGFARVVEALHRAGADANGPPFVIFHEVIDHETEGDIEMCIPVIGNVTTASVPTGAIPGGQVATTTHRGPYEGLPGAYHALGDWIVGHGFETNGPPRETYLTEPGEGDRDQITRVDWPVRAVET